VHDKRREESISKKGTIELAALFNLVFFVRISLGLPWSRYLVHERLNGIDQTSIISAVN
jgi:hypothetical protein